MNAHLKKVSNFFHRSKVIACLILILIFAASVFAICFSDDPKSTMEELEKLSEGTVMTHDVYVECDFKTVDREKLHRECLKKVRTIPLYYRRDPGRNQVITEKLEGFFIKKSLMEPDVSKYIDGIGMAECKKIVSRIIDEVLGKGILAEAENSGDPSSWYSANVCETLPELSRAGKDLKRVVYDVAGGTLRTFAAPFTAEEAAEKAAGIAVPDRAVPDEKQRRKVCTAFAGIFRDCFSEGNLTADREKTSAEADEKLGKIKEQSPRFEKIFCHGDRLLEEGQMLNSYRKKYLDDYCRQQRENSGDQIKRLLRRGVKISLCILLICFTALYIYHIKPDVTCDNKSLLILSCIAVVSLLSDGIFANVFRSHFINQCGVSPQLLFLALPLSLPAILTSAIYGPRTAVYMALFVSSITAIVFDNSFAVLLTGLLAGSVAGFWIYNDSNYKVFFGKSLAAVIFTTMLAGTVFLCRDFRPDYVWDAEFVMDAAALCVFSGFLTTLASLLILFILESVFGVSTNMTYLSFIDRNHKLLKKLQLNAPGTYSHSSDVAFIGESAADAIGANSLRLQACALYHDIGKLKAPAFFTENSPDENPHEKLSPRESAEAIRKHVSNGVMYARQYKLDGTILDAIEQHHGTDFVGSFYQQAKQLDPDNPPDEADFRYAGPLPQSKENVILCLADCAEAISRGLPKTKDGSGSYEELLERKLDEVILAKLKNGQFNEAPLTLQELHLVRNALLTQLVRIHHVRKADYLSSPSDTGESAK